VDPGGRVPDVLVETRVLVTIVHVNQASKTHARTIFCHDSFRFVMFHGHFFAEGLSVFQNVQIGVPSVPFCPTGHPRPGDFSVRPRTTTNFRLTNMYSTSFEPTLMWILSFGIPFA
jgi:hypothetical protein